MKKFLSLLNSPPILLLLVLSGLSFDLILLGLQKGLNAAEWAGWVQALGSIGALGVAIYVMSWQSRRAAKQAAAANLDRQVNLHVAVTHASIRLKTGLKGVHDVLTNPAMHTTSNLHLRRVRLVDAMAAMDRIPLWEISGTTALDLGALSELCGTSIALIDLHISTPTGDLVDLADRFRKFQDFAETKHAGLLTEYQDLANKLERARAACNDGT